MERKNEIIVAVICFVSIGIVGLYGLYSYGVFRDRLDLTDKNLWNPGVNEDDFSSKMNTEIDTYKETEVLTSTSNPEGLQELSCQNLEDIINEFTHEIERWITRKTTGGIENPIYVYEYNSRVPLDIVQLYLNIYNIKDCERLGFRIKEPIPQWILKEGYNQTISSTKTVTSILKSTITKESTIYYTITSTITLAKSSLSTITRTVANTTKTEIATTTTTRTITLVNSTIEPTIVAVDPVLNNPPTSFNVTLVNKDAQEDYVFSVSTDISGTRYTATIDSSTLIPGDGGMLKLNATFKGSAFKSGSTYQIIIWFESGSQIVVPALAS